MKTLTIKAQGLDKVLRNAERFAKDKVNSIDRELDTAVQNIAAEARSKATGSVASSIQADTSTRLKKSVRVSSPIAAFVEFGTGAKVFVSKYVYKPAVKSFARLFFVSGKGKTGAHPTLFPAFDNEIPKLMGRIKKVIFGH